MNNTKVLMNQTRGPLAAATKYLREDVTFFSFFANILKTMY